MLPESEQVHLSQDELAALEAAEIMACQGDQDWLLTSGKLKIITKKFQMVDLDLNSEQAKLLALMKTLEAAGKPVRVLVLKARQVGFSTCLEGLIYSRTSQSDYVNSLVLADDDGNATELFNKCKLFQDELEKDYPHLAPEIKRNNAKALEFKNRYSKVTIATAMAARKNNESRVGRSRTLKLVHLSECAYYPQLNALLLGLLQSVPNEPGTVVVLETTANGMGGDFYELWRAAKKGKSDWAVFFSPWFNNPDYAMALDSGESLDPLDEEEQGLIENFGLGLKQLKWRRWCIANNCNGDLDLFRQEYPATDEEAFIAGGKPIFDVKSLRAFMVNAPEPLKVGVLELRDGFPVLVDNAKGELKIWQEPEPGHSYLVAADVAEGLAGGDYSYGFVLDLDTLRQVAEWHGHTAPDLWGAELYKIGMYFERALLAVEVNNHGLTTLNVLAHGHPSEGTPPYPNLYYRVDFDQATQQESKKLGWHTNQATRPLMLGTLGMHVRERTMGLVSKDLIAELLSFIKHPDGSTGAPNGGFDDRVIGAAIAAQVAGMDLPASRGKGFLDGVDLSQVMAGGKQ